MAKSDKAREGLKPVQAFLTPDEHKALRLYAVKNETTVSELIRDYLRGLITQKQPVQNT